ncbi:transcriptional repressor [Modestobacter marinus]|uniref:Transcriptional repressor n=1 Tax=Modestobacter marinus TaxID=477641 RepID=A0ABQ2FU50_9ACTN|nr:transcriptional repressor [Modestobacter marinus]
MPYRRTRLGTVSGPESAPPLAAELRARGLRLTSQRQRVLAAVAALEHGTPEEIGARLRADAGPGGAAPDTSTVYRTLELLERLGLVWHTHLGKGAPIYHAAQHPHLHVVCQSCGEVQSVDPALLDGAAERLGAQLGFTLDVGHVALSGTCRACAEKEDA